MLQASHGIDPVYNQDSKILILGSFPSVKSREGNFFYHHPQNRFWKILAIIYDNQNLITIENKKQFLLENNIALWDVIASCSIEGSSDSSIENVIVNDLSSIINKSNITKIYTNGNVADRLYQKYCFPILKIAAVKLPSSSPANASYSLDRLIEAWKVID